jgi:glyoxylase-like metal-dependent hydrolase (beta-lactamase superfamily II)
MSSDTYQIYGVKYAHHPNRPARENFIGGDEHDGPMPLDFFVWAVVGEERTFILDTGFDEEMGKRRRRDFIRSPAEGLKMVGVEPDKIADVVISHMHYDHCGNHAMFPRATYHIQDKEMAYCTGRCMCHPAMRLPFEPVDVKAMVDRLYEGRVRFHDGVDELAPGVTVHHVGGHTMGLQALRVKTRRGWVVLASDAAHLYANMEEGRPFPLVYNVAEMLEGHKMLQRLGTTPRHVIPGHDPLIMKRYPAPKPALEGIVVRLDVDPVA